MMIKSLSHLTISSINIRDNIKFYTNVLGLIHGETLKGAEPGAYFYVEDNPIPVVHIVDEGQHSGSKTTDFHLDAKSVKSQPTSLATGALDHIAFNLKMKDFDILVQRLQEYSVPYKIGQDLMPRMKQIWALDPNGIKIELNFS